MWKPLGSAKREDVTRVHPIEEPWEILKMLRGRTKQYCRQLDVHPDTKRGQHFLISRQILRKEVHLAHLSKRDTVLDIGAGFGFLTEELVEGARYTYAIEKDRRIANLLKERLVTPIQEEQLEVIVGDVMDLSLPNVTKIVSNPPYHIISPLLIKIFQELFSQPDFRVAVLILQKTYAERLLAKPGGGEWGRLPAALSYFGGGEIICEVPRRAFWPMPEVPSALVKLLPREKSTQLVPFSVYEKTTQLLFSYPNKKVRNAVKIVLENRGREWQEIAEHILRKVGKWTRVRELRKADIMEIANVFLAENIIQE